MANSTTNLDLIAASQANKEVTLNAALDAASPAMLYGRRAVTTAGLAWGYYGGTASVGGTPTAIANGTLTLTASATNYVQADPATGAVSANTTGFTAGYKQLYAVVTGASGVTSYTDLRTLGGAGSGTVTSVGLSTPGVLFDVAGSPVTAAGTLAMSLKTQAANKVLAGPVTGADAAPTMRALVAADLPAQPFDLTAFYPGVPAASAIVTRVPVARAVTFPSGLAGSIGKASVAATGSAAFDVQKNGASVGTITFAAGATSATFAAASAITLAAGDLIAIISPGTADATLANVGIVLAGVR
jgi:hypothetical protein